MNIETQEKVFNETVETMRSIMFKKGNDYANEDRLSNFKLAGTIAGGKAETNCLNLIATKVARLGVLLNADAEPNNESIEDSIIDLANYAVLLRMILIDARPKTGEAEIALRCDKCNAVISVGDIWASPNQLALCVKCLKQQPAGLTR